MDLPPINDKRCDSKMCRYACVCNYIVLLLTLILITGFAQADMSIDRLIVNFQPESAHHQDVKVFNKGNNNLYVNVNVLEVLNPGTEKEQRVPVKDVKKLSLIATPKKMIVPSNSHKNVRLVLLEDAGKTDRIFRVSYSPALGKLKAKTSGIKILVAYQSLVIIRPNNPVAHITAERKGDKIIFRNSGNTNAILQNGQQCHPKDKNKCEVLSGRRLYAGNTWEFKPPYSGPVTFEVDDGKGVKTQTFPGSPSLKRPPLH